MIIITGDFDLYVVEIEELLRDVCHIVKLRGREILSDFEITTPQFDALLVINENNNITMGNLCDRMSLACSTVTDLIDRMEKNNLVERIRDNIDRRITRLRLKDKGNDIINEVLKARKAYLQSILKNIGEHEKEQLIKSLKQISELMHAQGE